MMYLHLVSLSVLGIALLWSLKLVYGRRETASDDVLLLVSTIAAWVLIFLGLAFASNPPVMVAGFVIAAMVVSQYRDSERRALLWTLAVAAEHGLPLATAARSFAAGRIDETGRRAARLAELLDAGVALPLALVRSRNPLPTDAALAANLGYATDSLADTLRDAAREGDRLSTVTHAYYSNLLYFVLIVNLLLGVMTFLCITVVPAYRQILADFSVEPPSITRFVLAVAVFAVDYASAVVFPAAVGECRPGVYDSGLYGNPSAGDLAAGRLVGRPRYADHFAILGRLRRSRKDPDRRS